MNVLNIELINTIWMGEIFSVRRSEALVNGWSFEQGINLNYSKNFLLFSNTFHSLKNINNEKKKKIKLLLYS